MNGRTDRQTDGRTDEQTDRQTDRQTDGKDRQTNSCIVTTTMPPHLPPAHILAGPADLEHLNENIREKVRRNKRAKREKGGEKTRTTGNKHVQHSEL